MCHVSQVMIQVSYFMCYVSHVMTKNKLNPFFSEGQFRMLRHNNTQPNTTRHHSDTTSYRQINITKEKNSRQNNREISIYLKLKTTVQNKKAFMGPTKYVWPFFIFFVNLLHPL